jgi:hypothetical protein
MLKEQKVKKKQNKTNNTNVEINFITQHKKKKSFEEKQYKIKRLETICITKFTF